MLKNELQRKNEMLLSANEKIEKLSGSDKQLTEALKKEQNATELYAKAKAEHESAMALRSASEKEYADKIKAAEKAKTKHDSMVENEKKLINAEASRMSKAKTSGFFGILIGSLLCNLFLFILTACRSDRFSTDFISFACTGWNGIKTSISFMASFFIGAWDIKECFSQDIAGISVAVTVEFVLAAILVTALYFLIRKLIIPCIKFYVEFYADQITVAESIFTLGILVWFADAMAWIPWNLVCVWFVLHGIYAGVRLLIMAISMQ
jgi:hypothetical protein